MTERGLPIVDSAPACPFVAFEDDREARATSPDHRHRCYAEPVPSPRAAAHQEAYCLSSAFPVCPTFQDWARREAAHARGEGARPAPAPSARPETTVAAGTHDTDADDEDRDRPYHPATTEDPPIRRNPPRDWAAPPPWAPGGSGAGATQRSGAGGRGPGEQAGPDFLAGRTDESRGLAGSAADRLAVGPAAASVDASRDATGYEPGGGATHDEELASLVSGRRVVERPPAQDYLPPSRPARRPSVSSTRAPQRDAPQRDAIVGPSWERARRYEAYPTIRSRTGLPALPRLAVLAGAVVIAAVALFFLPALLGIGGGGEDRATPSPSASQGVATASPEPTAPPAPTGQTYLIKAGDTLFGVADDFGLTLEELLAANPQITDRDKVAIGDEIVIPTKPPDEFTEPSAEPTP